MKKFLTTIVLLVLTFLSFNIQAQTSNLSVQGVLRTAEGTAVENGEYDVVFKIYNQEYGGAPLWEEEIAGVQVKGGIYSVVLGSGTTPLDVPFNEPYFLGVSVEGGIELTPRARLTSSPYALSLIGDDNIFPNSGNVGVGSASPQNKLTVQRGNGILGLEAVEDANNTATITTTTEGLRFDAGGIDKTHTFHNGDIKVGNGDIKIEQGDLKLTDGAFVFFDEANAPSTQASLDFDAVENQLNLKNEIGDIQVEGTQIDLNPTNQVRINKNGEGFQLVGVNSSFMGFYPQGINEGRKGLLGFNNSNNQQDVVLSNEIAEGNISLNTNNGEIKMNSHLNISTSNSKVISGRYFRKQSQYTGVYTSNNANLSLSVNGFILADEFYASSDQRIKKDLKFSNGLEDLKTLNQIEVTDYRHIDEVKNGPAFKKGLIAQQIKSVFPEAVSLSTQFIPNVYTLSSKIKTEENQVTITLEKPHGIEVNDKVRVMIEDGEEELVVQNIENEFSFTVAPQKIKIEENVFVYGKEVNDFHTVDYDRVFTLAVSATQEPARKVEELEKENVELKSTITNINDVLKSLKAEVKSNSQNLKMTGQK